MNTYRNRLQKSKRIRLSAKSKSDYKLRLSVYRSNKSLFAQIIDDKKGITLVGVSSKSISTDIKNNLDKAKEVGKILAEKALAKKINTVYFDRGYYKFHGRIKALAEAARAAGLKF